MTRSASTLGPRKSSRHRPHERAGRDPRLVGQQLGLGDPAPVVDGDVKAQRSPAARGAVKNHSQIGRQPGGTIGDLASHLVLPTIVEQHHVQVAPPPPLGYRQVSFAN